MAQDIGKALQELSKAIENNEAVESVVIKITLKKQKSDKASNPKESKQLSQAGNGRETALPVSPIILQIARYVNGAGGKGLNMVIRKGSKEYTIAERRECWVVSCKIGELSVEYKVPKDICTDEEELRADVEAEELFQRWEQWRKRERQKLLQR